MEEFTEQNEMNGEMPKEENEKNVKERVCKILVIGVGGAGNNAVNRMIKSNIQSADFAALNTDKQDLMVSEAERVIVLGEALTKGLGAGSNPTIGKKAAEESRDVIKGLLEGVDLLFITAGMGGGTGTGAAPVIANIAHDLGILTIAVVTTPFRFEGERRMAQAESGINDLRQYVDTLLVVPNEKLLEVMPKGTKFAQAFSYADDVLRQGIQGIADLIVNPAMINLDFADVRTVLREKGFAHIGIGVGEGETRMVEAVRAAVNNKLLETNISEATAAILNITGGEDLELSEVEEAGTIVRNVLNPESTVIFGADLNPSLGNKVIVTIIATGFKHASQRMQSRNPYTPKTSPIQPTLPKENPLGVQSPMTPPPINRPTYGKPKDTGDSRIPISDNDLPAFMKRLKK